MSETQYNVGIVGATGLVGSEMIQVLEDRNFPVGELYLWASERSAGAELEFQSRKIKVEELNKLSFSSKKLDFVLFAGGGGVSAEYAPLAADTGAIVIDNSSHFRLQTGVPLVVPEVNPEAVENCKETGIIANPNCSTIQMVVALQPLHEAAGIKRVIVSSYQSVSGAGSEALDEMQQQVSDLFAGKEIKNEVFPHQIAFNCIPHIDVFFEDGFSKEEMKMILETRKIMNLPDLKITATAVRVPVFISHAESINIEFNSAITADEAREVLENAPGVIVWDDPKEKLYPTPFEVAGQDEVFVGRVRQDKSTENALHLWVVADNLRKGAATNAIQIAETCIARKFRRLAA